MSLIKEVIARTAKIVSKSIPLLQEYKINKFTPVLDYVEIFPQNEKEADEFLFSIRESGDLVFKAEMGNTYKLFEPIKTDLGDLELLRIRLFDPSRLPFIGHSDFAVSNYIELKEILLSKDTVNLIVRPGYEMLEICDDKYEILVYIPNVPLTEDIAKGLTSDI